MQARHKAERQAFAFAVLGTASDIMKSLLLSLHAALCVMPATSTEQSRSPARPRILSMCNYEIVLESSADQTPALLQVRAHYCPALNYKLCWLVECYMSALHFKKFNRRLSIFRS